MYKNIKISSTQLAKILSEHKKWLEGEGGKRANLWRANLRGADLSEDNLWGANLRGADLRGADLRGSYLRGANLGGANLRRADLRGADLRGAYLRGADLREADLWGADLREAYLGEADLRGADLRGADLREAYLRGMKYNKNTRFPSPSMLLLANWRKLSEELTIRGMQYDAHNHPRPESFNEWICTNRCPFKTDEKYQRSFNFQEIKYLWSPLLLEEQPLTAIELAEMCLKEKCKFIS